MATTTTKSKAKTKTTKKPAAKAASAKTASATKTVKTTAKASASKAKTVKKTVAKKPAAKAPAKVAVNKVVATTSGRNNTFLMFGAIFALLAGFAGYFMKLDTVQLFLGHLTKNELASSAGAVLVSAAHPLFEIEFRWLLVVLLGVSAVFAIVRGTRWQAREIAGVKAGVQPTRWIDLAITGALIFQIVALLNGLQDVVALKFGALSIALLAYFAWMYERENAATGKPARASLIGAQLAALVPVVMLGATLYGTFVYGAVRSPWYVYAALAAFVLWLLATVTTLKRTPQVGKHNYLSVDTAYNVQAVVIKVVLAVILIVGLYDKK